VFFKYIEGRVPLNSGLAAQGVAKRYFLPPTSRHTHTHTCVLGRLRQ